MTRRAQIVIALTGRWATRQEVAELVGTKVELIDKEVAILVKQGRLTADRTQRPMRYSADLKDLDVGVRAINYANQIRDLMNRPDGVTTSELKETLKCTKDRVHWHVCQIQKTDAVFKRKMPNSPMRIFGSSADASRWARQEHARNLSSAEAQRERVIAKKAADRAAIAAERAAIAADVARMERERRAACPATVTIPPLPIAEISTNPNGVRVVVQPMIHYDPRYQVDPSTRVVGGFASAGIGRYL